VGALRTVAVLIAAATIAAVESRRPARADDGTTGFGLFVGSAYPLPATPRKRPARSQNRTQLV